MYTGPRNCHFRVFFPRHKKTNRPRHAVRSVLALVCRQPCEIITSRGCPIANALRGCPIANVRRTRKSRGYPNANGHRGCPIANGRPTGPG